MNRCARSVDGRGKWPQRFDAAVVIDRTPPAAYMSQLYDRECAAFVALGGRIAECCRRNCISVCHGFTVITAIPHMDVKWKRRPRIITLEALVSAIC